jgi:thymidylate synthase (FAD)
MIKTSRPKKIAKPSSVTRAHRPSKRYTLRTVAADMERLLHKPVGVLDQGFIRVVDYMGDEGAIVQAARISYGRGTKTRSEDKALIRYLLRNRHTTPFEMCEIKFHIRLPIFVARQWVRHRTANINEHSARYSILPNEFYCPEPAVVAEQSSSNRQGRKSDAIPRDEAKSILRLLKEDAQRSFDVYRLLLNEDEDRKKRDPARPQLSRELARIGLPLSTYTEWYWKIDLHNLLNFIRLRASPHAQYEIRAYAEEIAKIVRRWTPNVFQAFEDHELNSISLSGPAIKVLQDWLHGKFPTRESSGLSKSEWQEMTQLFGKN